MLRLHRNDRTRCGLSLIEMTAVIATTVVLSAVTASALVAAFRADRTLARRADDARTLAILANRLRQDIHAAANMAWDADAQRLTLSRGGGKLITYDWSPERCRRRTKQARDGSAQETEGVFQTPGHALPQVEPSKAAGGALVRIHFRSTGDRTGAADRVASEIVAMLGRDMRLLSE